MNITWPWKIWADPFCCYFIFPSPPRQAPLMEKRKNAQFLQSSFGFHTMEIELNTSTDLGTSAAGTFFMMMSLFKTLA